MRSPFFSVPGSGREAFIFTSPQSFIRHVDAALFEKKDRRVGVLALFEPSERAIHQYVAEHSQVRTVHVVPLAPSGPSPVELDFFNNLKSRLRPFGIAVEHAPKERDLSRSIERGVPDLGLSL